VKIVSFNVNGIRARLHQLAALIESHRPDVIGLQETKVENSLFPIAEIRALGYEAVFHGQRGHYGVALLYRGELLASTQGFPADEEDAQCRLVSVTLPTSNGPLTIYNGYFPQGENRAHPIKFPAKEAFYRNFREHLDATHDPGDALVVMGDMNVAPLDKDIGIGEQNRKRWLRTGKCCFLPEEREWLTRLCQWGLYDSYEHLHTEGGEQRYSWFDYRSRGFEDDPKRGLRIDLVLVSKSVLERQRAAGIDQHIRAMEKPSDHCPVWIEGDF